MNITKPIYIYIYIYILAMACRGEIPAPYSIFKIVIVTSYIDEILSGILLWRIEKFNFLLLLFTVFNK